ncbi:ANTAR domain protein [Arthrobacter saudimassiliensis]|uniref:ANTAR domain protein n=1 Tax=Arthrobacter saudimassiliensis TaxID=1461584 RepID=A0A078MSY7_9MICC|nr:ANTAR domain protein [Arthrobacter saudimassiliensis]
MRHQPTPQELSEALIGIVLKSPGLEGFLNELTSLAAAALSRPGEEFHCAVTLIRSSGPRVLASSTELAQQADELQYAHGDGPCLRAAVDEVTTEVTDFRTDQRWPEYFEAAVKQGIRAVLAVPMSLPGQTKSGLNIYGTEPHVFSEPEADAVKEFARQATAAVQLAVRIADMETTSEDLLAAMSSRTTIDLAVGIIMGQSRCSQDEAFRILRAASSHRNRKLRDIAAELVQSLNGAAPETHFELHD